MSQQYEDETSRIRLAGDHPLYQKLQPASTGKRQFLMVKSYQ
jgi:hypothetical protein